MIGGCVAIRVAIPLASLAAEGTALPGLPAFRYGPLYGDANGYYAAAREIVAAVARMALPLVVIAVFAAGLLYGAVRRRARPALIAGVAAAGASSAATLVVLEMRPAGAPVVGWPLLWAFGLVPLRLLAPGFGPDAAFVVGVGISFLAIGATVVAVAYVGLWSSGKRTVGLLAAALFALWPLVPGLVVGERGWENGTWLVDSGLALYTEPLSTALVVGAIALLLCPAATDLAIVIAGLALGYATVVKLTDGVIVAALVGVLLVTRRWRHAALLAVAGFVSAPLFFAYWDKGYVATYDGGIAASEHPFGLEHIVPAWGDSLLFSPLLVALLVLPAMVGLSSLRGAFPKAAVTVPIVVTVVTYSLYDATPIHPRFLYVALPLVLVLDAAGVLSLLSAVRARRSQAESVRVL